jgi:hypothetical protein
VKVCDKTCIFRFFPIINKYFLMAKRSLLSRCPSYNAQITGRTGSEENRIKQQFYALITYKYFVFVHSRNIKPQRVGLQGRHVKLTINKAPKLFKYFLKKLGSGEKSKFVKFCSTGCPTRCNVTQFILSGNCSTCFGWYHHPSSEAKTTVSTASGICHTVTAICRYRGRVGTGLSVLWTVGTQT